MDKPSVYAVESKLYWNGDLVEYFNLNRNYFSNVYWNGELVLRPLPIPSGSYIHYELDKETGFFTDTTGINYIVDKGQIGMPLNTGNFPGTMFSGNSLNLTNGYIDVPINGETSGINENIGNYWSANFGDGSGRIIDNNTTNFRLIVDEAGTTPDRPFISIESNNLDNKTYKLSFDIKVNSGNVYLKSISHYIQIDIEEELTTGHYEYIFDIDKPSDYFYFIMVFNSDKFYTFDSEFSNVAVEEVVSSSGSVMYYDFDVKQFVQETNLPISSRYRIENKEIGPVVVLWNNEFSQNDLDVFNADPAKIIEWYKGDRDLESQISIVVEEDDKFFANTETSGKYLFDMDLEHLDSILENGNFESNDYWESIDGNLIIYDNKAFFTVPNDRTMATLMYNNTNINLHNKKYKIKIALKLNNVRRCEIRYSSYSDLKHYIFVDGVHEFIVEDIYNLDLRLDFIGDGTAEIDYILLEEITSPVIKIQGDFERTFHNKYGLQNIRIDRNTINLPKRLIDGNFIRFNGTKEYVNTGIAIDGITNNFSMMLGFSLPVRDMGRTQFIASAPGNPGLYLVHRTGTPLNVLTVGIGDKGFEITFDTSYAFHAIVMVWDVVNQTIQFAYDDTDLTNPIPFSFNGHTNHFIMGAYNETGSYSFNGYVGEGILSSNIIDNQTWLDFWNKIKNSSLFELPYLLDCDEYYFCEDDWKCPEMIELPCEDLLDCSDYISCFG